ncbi:MAG TPA: peptidyl-prolyl cis-trans isomerase [Tepidisphaeraceae bacterium]|jgi:parvulin-like peptidyl-prolyl isomerase|nr:peptidyl-prolyl cis-trans isomerase [Tepidisphaeraceae bacterium]
MALLINDQRIDDGILQSEFAEIKTYFERLGNISCCERDDEFRGYARENIIARVLLAQESKRRLEPTPEPQVDAAVAELIERYGGEVQFYAATGASPSHMDLVRHDVEVDLRVKRLMDEMCADIAVSEDQLLGYYEKNIDRFMTPEEVRASHILKSPKRGEEREAAYATLRQARGELLKGAGFDEIAKKHSDKADEHIDLGFFKRGELTEEFELVAFSMEVGEISPVFASSFGFHLIKLTERKPSAPKPFETVREEVRQQYIEGQRQERAKRLVDELKTGAKIEDVPDEAEALASMS